MIFTPGNKKLKLLGRYHILIMHVFLSMCICSMFEETQHVFIISLPYTLIVSILIGLAVLRYHTKIVIPLIIPMSIIIGMILGLTLLYSFTKNSDLVVGLLIFYGLLLFSIATIYQTFVNIAEIGICINGDTDDIKEKEILEIVIGYASSDRFTHDQMHLIYSYRAAVAFRDNIVHKYSITDEVVTNSKFNRNGHNLYKILEKSQTIAG
jgi:hypothetical protein